MSCADQHLSQGQPEPASNIKTKKYETENRLQDVLEVEVEEKIKYSLIFGTE